MQNTIPGRILSKILKGIALSLALVILVFAQGASAKTDEEKANFRTVQAGSMGKNVLYRSAHPAKPTKSGSTARAKTANKLAEAHGIRTILNLADSNSDLKKNFKKLNVTSSNYYYAKLYENGQVSASGMSGPDGNRNSSYRKKMTKAIRFFTTHEGPYLVHCLIGRDRTGITIEVLLGLMGASYDYMLEDWAKTDPNLNGTSASRARENARERLNADLKFITGKNLSDSQWKNVDFRPYVEDFLKKGGMTAAEVETLKKNLSKSYTDNGKPTDGSGNEGSNSGGNTGDGGGDTSGGEKNRSTSPGPEPDVTIRPEKESQCTSILNSSLCDEGNGEESIIYIIKFVANTLTIGIVTLGTIGIIISGFIIITASGDESKIRMAKTRIIEIVVGFLLWALLYIILGLFLPNTPSIEETSSSETTSQTTE